MFADILPGIEASYDKDGPPVTIYGQVSKRDRQAAIASRRLASPDLDLMGWTPPGGIDVP